MWRLPVYPGAVFLTTVIGGSRQTINAIELCKYIPFTVLALKIARFFGKPGEEIFQSEDSD